MLIRRLRTIQNEWNTLWDFDEADDLPDIFALTQREKELEAETEQLLLSHGLDPDRYINQNWTKSLR